MNEAQIRELIDMQWKDVRRDSYHMLCTNCGSDNWACEGDTFYCMTCRETKITVSEKRIETGSVS
jgi:hypothetical protein